MIAKTLFLTGHAGANLITRPKGKMTYRQRQTRQIKLPARWPNDVHYLQSCQFNESITPSLRDFVEGNPSIAGQLSISYPICVTIRHIVNPAHPANGQRGLFAASHIKPNTRILDYIGRLNPGQGDRRPDGAIHSGEIHCDNRSTSDYDLCLHRFPDGSSLGIDAHKSGNEARFINDYRGISKRPNAIFRDNRMDTGELRVSIWSSSEGIRKGDEILVSYGKSWWQARSA